MSNLEIAKMIAALTAAEAALRVCASYGSPMAVAWVKAYGGVGK